MSIGQGAGVLAIQNGKVLAFQQTRNAGKGVGIPGGKWEECDVDLFATACRECFEETGLTVVVVAKTPAFVDECNGIEFATFLVFVQGEIKNDRLHEGEACWVDVNDLLEGPYAEYNRKMLNHFGQFLHVYK